ncbi:MAG: hypothetical protein AB7P21_08820 [Lautropia sp.]
MSGRRAKRVLGLATLALLCLAAAPATAGPWRANERNVVGWQFMTPDERIEHQRRLRSLRSLEACRAYLAAHHALMAQRAREAGKTLTPAAESVCDRLKAQGLLE